MHSCDTLQNDANTCWGKCCKVLIGFVVWSSCDCLGALEMFAFVEYFSLQCLLYIIICLILTIDTTMAIK